MFFNLKKIFILLLMLGIIIPIFSFAVTVKPGTVAAPGVKGIPEGVGITKADQLFGILADILKYIYEIFFIVAVLFIIMTAYTYLTAQDDVEKIKNAHKQLIWAAVAIAVALISLSFETIISNFIKPSGGGLYDTPTTMNPDLGRKVPGSGSIPAVNLP